jgi:hypothetical protein
MFGCASIEHIKSYGLQGQALIPFKKAMEIKQRFKNWSELFMKKRFFDLQLFAEETATAVETGAAAAEQEKATEQKKEPETAAEPAKTEPKYTDADVDKIISKKFAEWERKQEKKVDEAKKLAEMDATQKAEYKAQQLQKELDEYKRKDTLAEMTKTARKMLSDEGITISDELLSVMVTPEAESTKAAISGFATQYKAAVEAEVKNRLRGETPTVGTGGATSTLSEIDKRLAKYK